MRTLTQKLVATIILSSFLAISFGSFVVMIHEPRQVMTSNCPFSALDQTLCPQNTLAVVIHHLLAYHSFLNVPLVKNLSLFLLSTFLSLIGAWWLIIRIRPLLVSPVLNRLLNDSPPKQSGRPKISRWLALLENSPASF